MPQVASCLPVQAVAPAFDVLHRLGQVVCLVALMEILLLALHQAAQLQESQEAWGAVRLAQSGAVRLAQSGQAVHLGQCWVVLHQAGQQAVRRAGQQAVRQAGRQVVHQAGPGREQPGQVRALADLQANQAGQACLQVHQACWAC